MHIDGLSFSITAFFASIELEVPAQAADDVISFCNSLKNI